jgi:DegV family protein with EDD domain
MFEIFVDSGANIPAVFVEKYNINVIAFINIVDGRKVPGFESGLSLEEERAKGKEYYDAIRGGAEVKTSLINSEEFREHFEPVLKEGKDLLYISLSSNISGTFNAARIAAEELREEYPEREIRLVDSLNASLAQGILAIYARELQDKGYSLTEIADVLAETAHSMNGTFTVDDLKYLARTGRLHGATAVVGNLLKVKPILCGNRDGFIVQHCLKRGRKKSLNALIDFVCDNIVEPEKQIVGIAHADAYEDSLYVMNGIMSRVKVRDFINTSYDFCTGSHVGPDTIALFFIGYDRELQGKLVDENLRVKRIFDML